jgi:protein PhnA
MKSVLERSGGRCELCGSTESVTVLAVPPRTKNDPEDCVVTCQVCREQIDGESSLDNNHWRCLNESIWSVVPAVQVISWRLLQRLNTETWAQDLLQQVYLEESLLQWAQTEQRADEDDNSVEPTLDSNGNVLNAGDSVTLIKDLVVKGGGFTAKRGTLVKNIVLTSNPKHVEGRVNGTVIVLVAAFLKKAS